MNFILKKLPYDYDAMEPFFDKQTMHIHHTKHHQTYINNTNKALENLPKFKNLTIEELIKQIDLLPNEKKDIVRNNAGGHINHQMFWEILKKGTCLHGNLKTSIEHNFHTVEKFKTMFEDNAINRFGSGWTWLIKKNNKLEIISTANQDNPLMNIISPNVTGYPIIGLDVWEHAYYLKYQNRRIDYIKAFWNIVNWDEAELRFNKN